MRAGKTMYTIAIIITGQQTHPQVKLIHNDHKLQIIDFFQHKIIILSILFI